MCRRAMAEMQQQIDDAAVAEAEFTAQIAELKLQLETTFATNTDLQGRCVSRRLSSCHDSRCNTGMLTTPGWVRRLDSAVSTGGERAREVARLAEELAATAEFQKRVDAAEAETAACRSETEELRQKLADNTQEKLNQVAAVKLQLEEETAHHAAEAEALAAQLVSPPGPQINRPAVVFCVSWCANLEFRVTQAAAEDRADQSGLTSIMEELDVSGAQVRHKTLRRSAPLPFDI